MKIKSKGSAYIYKFYKIKCKEKNIKPRTLKECTKIWNNVNLKIKDLLINQSEEIQLPYQLGSLRVIKKKIDQAAIPDNKRKINWGETKKQGFKVYYINDYIYKVYWDRRRSKVVGSTLFVFKTCFTLRRDLAKAIKIHKKNYFK